VDSRRQSKFRQRRRKLDLRMVPEIKSPSIRTPVLIFPLGILATAV
jgi:hypothetical protein